MTGTIKKLMTDKGFGFVRGEDGVERFFHYTSVQGADFNDLREGETVSFEDDPSNPKGPRARDIRRKNGKAR